jgi:hypothetical protein
MENQIITEAIEALQQPDYTVLRQELVTIMGVDAYLESFKKYLISQPLTDAERFEIYYRTRCEIKSNN